MEREKPKSSTRLYRIWQNMKKRCFNPNHPQYKNYGGRGITVCDAWDNSFETFERWALSHGYADDLTIDRINNDGNYTARNCQWITRSENSKKMKEDHKKPRKAAPKPKPKTPEQIKAAKRRKQIFRRIYGDDWEYHADMASCTLTPAEKRRIKRRHDRKLREDGQ